jgi:hypothetical protein
VTPEQVEDMIRERIHQEPFVPFIVELADGSEIEISHPRLAVNGGGAGFFGEDGALIDFQFNLVRAIRPTTFQAIS